MAGHVPGNAQPVQAGYRGAWETRPPFALCTSPRGTFLATIMIAPRK
jgi:hypothetical protein